MKSFEFRSAAVADVQNLTWLYQKCAKNILEEPMLADAKKLTEALQSPQFLFFAGEKDGVIRVSLSFLLDEEHRFAKLHRIYIDPEVDEAQAFDAAIAFSKERLNSLSQVDVVYCTTRTLTLEQQEKTLAHGFAILGIFPSGPGIDTHRLNGMTAFFSDGVLERRQADFDLHPAVVPYFEIVRRQLELPALNRAVVRAEAEAPESLPALEWIDAPLFVKRKFQDLKDRRFLTNHFYPFQEPNVLITDPTQSAEIFLKVAPSDHFATIIGERVNLQLDPAKLYEAVLSILSRRGYSYIEIVSDAADTQGLECMMKAGFLPCAYIPAFKRHGRSRRDYVVLVHSLGRFPRTPAAINPVYLEFLKHYLELSRA